MIRVHAHRTFHIKNVLLILNVLNFIGFLVKIQWIAYERPSPIYET